MDCIHGLTAETCAPCKRGPEPDDSYHGPVIEPDYAWESRKHDVVTSRSVKGATQQKVVAFGTARVIGSLTADVNGNPLLAALPDDTLDPASGAARVLATAFDRGELRRGRYGFSAWDVNRLTRQAFALGEIDNLLGTDVKAFEQVIHGDRSSFSACVYRTSTLSDSDDAVSDMAQVLIEACSPVYGHDTQGLKWEPRYELPAITPRKPERARTRAAGTVELPAPDIDPEHYWHGFRRLPRAPLADRTSKRDQASKARNDARTIGTVKAGDTDDIARTLSNLNRGYRVVLAYPDGTTRTVTRSADGRYATPSDTPGKPIQARAATTMAERLAS